MKTLKFSDGLPEKILNGSKTATWRLNDEKDIVVGDHLSLCYTDSREFAKAITTFIKITTFGRMTDQDKEGHESSRSEEEMLKTFEKYYNVKVTPQTEVKIIKFKLL
ncbi:MAG: ASCH domain-containing protein [Candidatus Aenigmarchaeota archaeon]|nr:ASCH domain-containing protein [Candidatus Aenigmarchaeota archaeon]